MITDAGLCIGEELGAAELVGDVALGGRWGPLDGTRMGCDAVGCDVCRTGVCTDTGRPTAVGITPFTLVVLTEACVDCAGLATCPCAALVLSRDRWATEAS